MNVKTPLSAITSVVDCVLRFDAQKATKYLAPNSIVRCTRVSYGKKKPRKDQNVELVLTIGRPNYLEQEFIKKCKKAGEPFPVKKVQIKFYKVKK